MASPGNWMHLQYQSKLQARKALSKDGKVFGDCIMSAIRPLSASYRSVASDFEVVADRQTPRKDDSFVSKAMEYMFGW
uniref:Nucleoporin NUP35 n=1 Tax=Nothobranchius furzeri TaxID=105023 RepID=A0A1A8ATA2_NOTFU